MNTLVTLSLILRASAFAVPRSSCSFKLTASGGESGTIGQLSDGQNRIGGDLSSASFTINNGGITDSAGRDCILTPSVEQFQCDQGVGPTYSFAIDSSETLTYSGSSVFYACPASDTEWNIYTTPVTGQLKCVEITLTASGCGATTSVATSVTTVTVYDCGATSSILPVETYTAPVVSSSSSSSPAVETYTAPVLSSSATFAPASQYTASTKSVPVYISSAAPTSSVNIYQTSPEQYSSVTAISSMPTGRTTSLSSSYASYTPETVGSASSSTYSIITIPVYTYTPSAQSSTTLYSVTATPVTTTSSTPLVQSSSTCLSTALTGSYTSGNYQYPHLIVPISSSSPDTATGTSYFGTISSNTSTIFNFDIPSSYSGSTCNLIFLLPLHSELETSSYTFSGSGGVEFEQLSSAATEATTWDNAPSAENDLGEFWLIEGSSTLIETFACPAGETVGFEMSAVGDTYLYFFQDYNPSPLGLYITVC